MSSKDASIIIVGAGAWGLSTAMHLKLAGYKDITVYERAEQIPSPYSAAWDLNKIVRAEYEDPFYTNLALKAMEAWRTPLFGPYYHQTGYINAATGRAPPKAREHLDKALASISTHPVFAPGISALDGGDSVRKFAWQFTGPLTGFKGYFNALGGYAHSADTLKGIWEYCAGLGIRFVFGESAGRVEALLHESRSGKRRCIGVKTADQQEHLAQLTICALGAHNAALLPSLGRFTVARCWSVAHVQLSERETNYLRGIPTTNVRDLGFFFEPDPKTQLFKLCPLGAGYTNTNADGISLPPADRLPPPQDFIPYEDEKKLRQLLREVFPWMAERPFVEQKLCWFADSSDSEYCIDYVPETDNSLVVLSGDSGHGFKMMPVFGQWVLNLLQDREQKLQRWQWRKTDLRGTDWATAVSWRIGESLELKELIKQQQALFKAKL
ncbi:oxygen oxidoreductase [Polychaeton citri CBS 116435]|uniref:Oxygen oxidoreductase n=1 Tax=Polychaeton citri CBS 116435 TaxID=1314669 RepID=A0A9P4Q8B0_9PEZI|nr:oxygen oxidoreductase [Polychaeton citri CBS 116435]